MKDIIIKRIKGILKVQMNVWIRMIIVAAAIGIVFNFTTSSLLPITIGLLYLLVQKKEIVVLSTREKWVSIILSMIYSICIIAFNMDSILSFPRKIYDLISLIVCSTGIYLFTKTILVVIITGLRRNIFLDSVRTKDKKKEMVVFLVSFFVLMLIWGGFLTMSYPANMTRDSRTIFEELMEVKPLTAGNPIIYTMTLKFFYTLGYSVFKNVNAGVASCSIAQITFLVLIISYTIYKLYCCNIKKIICILVFIFYAFIPYNVQLSHTLWKDIPFAGFVFLYTLYIWDYHDNEQSPKKWMKAIKYLLFIFTGTCVCLFRHNGLYAFVFFIPFGIIMFMKKNKNIIFGIFVSLVCAMLIQGAGYDYIFNKENKGIMVTEGLEEQTGESIKNINAERVGNTTVALLMQPMARVVAENNNLDTEDYNDLSKIFNMKKVATAYNPHLFDSIFSSMNFKMSQIDIYRLWFRLGLKYPYTYFKAIVDQTSGYWYPDIQGWVYDDYIKENDLNIYKETVFSDDFLNMMRRIEDCYIIVPIYGIIWSIGFVVWITFFSIGITIIKKDIHTSFCYMILVGVWLTLMIATPVYDEFRYIYSFFLTMPLSLVIPFAKK